MLSTPRAKIYHLVNYGIISCNDSDTIFIPILTKLYNISSIFCMPIHMINHQLT